MSLLRSLAQALSRSSAAQRRVAREATLLAALHETKRDRIEQAIQEFRTEQARNRAASLLTKRQRDDETEDARLSEMATQLVRRQAKLS